MKVELVDGSAFERGEFGGQKYYRHWVIIKSMRCEPEGARLVQTVGLHDFYTQASTIGLLSPFSRGNAACKIGGCDISVTMTTGVGYRPLAVIAKISANEAELLAMRLLRAAKELRDIEAAP